MADTACSLSLMPLRFSRALEKLCRRRCRGLSLSLCLLPSFSIYLYTVCVCACRCCLSRALPCVPRRSIETRLQVMCCELASPFYWAAQVTLPPLPLPGQIRLTSSTRQVVSQLPSAMFHRLLLLLSCPALPAPSRLGPGSGYKSLVFCQVWAAAAQVYQSISHVRPLLSKTTRSDSSTVAARSSITGAEGAAAPTGERKPGCHLGSPPPSSAR